MTALRDHEFAASYNKAVDDIAARFYLPCMRSADRYDRVSGYFSSAVFSVAWPALKEFVKAGGRMRVICSPVLSAHDLAGLREGHEAQADEEIAQALVAELQVLLASSRSRKPTRVFAGLVASGVVELRMAMLSDTAGPGDRRLFHDKVGVFIDAADDAVGFRGSMNETYLGLAADGNLESVDVFPSWADGRDAARAREARERFEQLWSDHVPAVRVRALSALALTFIREAGAQDWEVLVDEVIAEASVREATPATARPLHDHQVEALATWNLHGRRGLLEHATGAGKTYTAIRAIREVLAEGGSAMVLVPSSLLLRQWDTELSTHLADIHPRILLVGDGNDSWRRDELLRPWTSPPASSDSPQVVVAMIPTAATEAFLTRVRVHQRTLVVADEAHRLGSTQARRLLELQAPWRLGLSATPHRAGDREGTGALLDYFGGILEPPYTLADAIADRVLTPYHYRPHEVELTPQEQDDYEDLTRRIRREAGQRGDALDDLSANDRLRKLTIARARILKQAHGKVDLSLRVLGEHYNPGQRWLVYCDSLAQLRTVRARLHAAGLPTLEYHADMAGDRQATLVELEINGGILVSIRCLDEGVDLPAVDHALILASSRNPREFIQRRGRILRRYPGKRLAHLHDAVTTPAPTANSAAGDRLLSGELHRVLDFAHGASNPTAIGQVEALCIRHGVPVDLDTPSEVPVGIEIDDEDGDDD